MKKAMPILVALGVLVAGAVLVLRMADGGKEPADADTVSLIAARSAIAAGRELTSDLLTTREVPRQFAARQAIGRGDVNLILGRRVAVALARNQIILWPDLETDAPAGFSALISGGERAFTVPLRKGISTTLIRPNDRVDIIASFPVPPSPQALAGGGTLQRGAEMINVVLLQNIPVVAVGDFFGDRQRAGIRGGGDLTLSVTLSEAQLLMFAQEHGDMAAVLRGEGDIESIPAGELPRVTFEEIEKIIGDLAARRHTRMIDIHGGGAIRHVPVNP